jgi:hypothetical protein
MPGNRVKGEIRVLVLHFERAGGDGNLNFLPGKSGLGVEAPPAEANIS